MGKVKNWSFHALNVVILAIYRITCLEIVCLIDLINSNMACTHLLYHQSELVPLLHYLLVALLQEVGISRYHVLMTVTYMI